MNKKLKLDVPLLVIIIFSLGNFVFVAREYAWADDWSFYSSYNGEGPSSFEEHLMGYRPLLQFLFDYLWPMMDSIDDLIVFRLISTLGMLLLSITVYRALGRLGFEKVPNLIFSVGVLFLPSFQIYQKWATTFAYSWCALLSIFSWKLFVSKKYVLSFVMLVAAFLIYQPAATFGLVIVFAQSLQNLKVNRENVYFCLNLVMTFLVGTLVGRLVQIYAGVDSKERAGIISSPEEAMEKLIWLITRPMTLAFRPFAWDSPTNLEILVPLLFFILCTYSLWSKTGRSFRSLTYILHVYAIFLLMLLPLIPIRENQIEYRVLPSTSAAGLLFIVTTMYFFVAQRAKLSRYMLPIGMFTLAQVAIYSYSITSLIFVKPYVIAKEFIEVNLNNIEGPKLSYHISYQDWPIRDFIGSPSAVYDLQMPWVAFPMVEYFSRDKFRVIELVPESIKEEVTVLDLDEIKSISIKSN